MRPRLRRPHPFRQFWKQPPVLYDEAEPVADWRTSRRDHRACRSRSKPSSAIRYPSPAAGPSSPCAPTTMSVAARGSVRQHPAAEMLSAAAPGESIENQQLDDGDVTEEIITGGTKPAVAASESQAVKKLGLSLSFSSSSNVPERLRGHAAYRHRHDGRRRRPVAGNKLRAKAIHYHSAAGAGRGVAGEASEVRERRPPRRRARGRASTKVGDVKQQYQP